MAETSSPYPMIDKPLPLTGGGVVQLYNLIVFATLAGAKSLSMQICRTRGQAEAREAITEIISLERAPDGSWRATDSADLSEGGA